MDGQGTFIAIEGSDGSITGAQYTLLVERLKQRGYQTAVFDFAQTTRPSAHFIEQYQRGDYGDQTEISPYTASLFYGLDRFEAARQIRAALRQGKVVVANQFSGSSIARLGATFKRREERLGYFTWSDQMDYSVLGLPRPATSLVLRPFKRLDGSTKVADPYDDLCELFPNYYQMLSSTSESGLLSDEALLDAVWGSIERFLPATRSAPARASSTKQLAPSLNLQIDDVSSLLLSRIMRSGLTVKTSLEKGEHPSYFTPIELDTELADQFQATLDRQLATYRDLLEQLDGYLQGLASTTTKKRRRNTHQQAAKALEELLPLATCVKVELGGSDTVLAELIRDLSSHPLAEARAAGAKLMNQANQHAPGVLNLIKPADLEEAAREAMRELADERLPNYSDDYREPVRLIDYSPRSELSLVPRLLYPYSSLSLSELEREVEGWSYDEKVSVLQTYFDERRNEAEERSANAHSSYSWDIVSTHERLRQLQASNLAETVIMQDLSPRYGYDIPPLVEQAGLGDDFERAFDLSYELYSTLQAAGFEREAQYAVLHGHHRRYQLMLTGPQLKRLVRERPASCKQLTDELFQTMAAVHPLSAELYNQ